jgi:hypothetical protein
MLCILFIFLLKDCCKLIDACILKELLGSEAFREIAAYIAEKHKRFYCPN